MGFSTNDFVYFVEAVGAFSIETPIEAYGTIDCFLSEEEENDLFFDESIEESVVLVKNVHDLDGKFIKDSRRAYVDSLEDGREHLKKNIAEVEGTLKDLKSLLEKQGDKV